MTELIVDAIEYVKNPYKGKKLKVMSVVFLMFLLVLMFLTNTLKTEW